MASRPAIDLEADIQPHQSAAVATDIRSYQAMVDELDELRDVMRGMADADAGRLVDHEEARRRLLERLS